MSNQQELEDKQTVWAYLLKNGTITEGGWQGWNQYAGNWDHPFRGKNGYSVTKEEILQVNKEIVDKILHTGVDWEKTNFPIYESHGEFMDTNSPSGNIDTIFGTIVLNNNEEFKFGAIHVDNLILDIIESHVLQTPIQDHRKESVKFWNNKK